LHILNSLAGVKIRK